MAEHDLSDFSINVETAIEDIIQLLKTIKPQWTPDNTEISKISGGFSSATYRVNSKDDEVEDAIVIRVRNLFVVKPLAIINYEYERKIVQIASTLGLFSKIYAMFKNGYCYQYIKGKPLVNLAEKVTSPVNLEDIPFGAIAEKLARIHSITVDDEDLSKSDFCEKYRQTLEDHYPNDPEANLIEKDIIRKEWDEMTGYINKLNLKVVLSHGDAHPGNMVWNKEEGKLTFVDWELTHIGYQVYDIVYFLKFFNSMEVLDIPNLPKYVGMPINKVQDDFINFYTEEYAKLTASNEFVKELKNHLKFASLFIRLTSTILLGSIRHQLIASGLPVDVTQIISKNFDEYNKSKDNILRELNLK